tara:strand:+ start:302 stop:778 length:477 start_codon:yes stop_codon:yes gene_type:complete
MDTDIDAHIYSKEETIQSFIDDLEEISVNETVKDDEQSINTENSDKLKKLLKRKNTSDDGYFKYNIIKGKKNIKVECYGTVQNIGNLIRCPYSGVRGNDRVGSGDENYYFKAMLPCISKGNNTMAFYYDTPEAFERHHLAVLSQDIKDKFYERKNINV